MNLNAKCINKCINKSATCTAGSNLRDHFASPSSCVPYNIDLILQRFFQISLNAITFCSIVQ